MTVSMTFAITRAMRGRMRSRSESAWLGPARGSVVKMTCWTLQDSMAERVERFERFRPACRPNQGPRVTPFIPLKGPRTRLAGAPPSSAGAVSATAPARAGGLGETSSSLHQRPGPLMAPTQLSFLSGYRRATLFSPSRRLARHLLSEACRRGFSHAGSMIWADLAQKAINACGIV